MWASSTGRPQTLHGTRDRRISASRELDVIISHPKAKRRIKPARAPPAPAETLLSGKV
jgi:hypothetical protein